MFEKALYAPYDDTSFAMGAEGLNVSSPWMSLDVDVDDDRKSALTQLLARIGEGGAEVLYEGETQDFLSFFAGFPLVHALPRKLASASALAYASAAPELLAAKGPREFLAAINPFEDLVVNEAFSYFDETWRWEVKEIEDASRIPDSDLFDPLSVYTAIRARRLQYQVQQSGLAQDLLARVKKLRASDEASFFRVLATLLAQQYYVTRECCSCLDPAIAHHALIRDQILAYKAEELHHDRLILKSIRELSDEDTKDFFFAPEVRLEIEVIKYAAKTCALGFSALVSIMEGTVYPASDPVGDILKQSSKPSAHVGVESHFQINKRGNHTAIPEAFVMKLPPVTQQTVAIAMRLAEVTILLDTGLARTMLQRLEQ